MGIEMADKVRYNAAQFENDAVNRKVKAMQDEVQKRITIASMWNGIVRERLTILMIFGVVCIAVLGLGTWNLYWKEYDQEQLRHKAMNKIDLIYQSDSLNLAETNELKDSMFLWHYQGLVRTIYRDQKIDSIQHAMPRIKKETLSKSIK